MQRRSNPPRRRLIGQCFQIAFGQWLDVGVGNGRRCPLKLADFGRHIMRCGKTEAGVGGTDDIDRLALMRPIGVSMQKDDGHGRDSGGNKPIGLLQHIRMIQFDDHIAVHIDTFNRFEAPIAGDQRRGL